jgi:hypothetical protein
MFVLRWHPAADGKGFESDSAEVPVTADRLGQVVLDVLRTSPRFPSRSGR